MVALQSGLHIPLQRNAVFMINLLYTFYMNIRMRYFASFREITGRNEEILTLPAGAGVADVRALLLARYPRLQAIMERSACAVNHSYVPQDTPLHDGDEVVFIPPVGGGMPVQENPQWNR